MAIKREDYMKFLKRYKDEHCKAISKMKKAELKIEAEKRGFLQERFGITPEVKTKKKEEKKAPVASPSVAKLSRKEIFAEIRKLEGNEGEMNAKEAKAVANKRKKLFALLKQA
jgi:hypothetical protein